MIVLLQALKFAGFSLGSPGFIDVLVKTVRGAVMSFYCSISLNLDRINMQFVQWHLTKYCFLLFTWLPLTYSDNLVYNTKVHCPASVTLGRDPSIIACEKLLSVHMGFQVMVCFNTTKCHSNTCFLVCIIRYLL